MRDHHDIVIGAGQAGPALAVRLASEGRRVALVEARELGGTCVNDGCIPTKALVASARAAWVARNAASWGIAISGEITVDMKAVKARKDAIVAHSVTSLGSWIGGTKNLELVMGRARFTSAHEIQVGDRTLSAERFFLNVGARASVPPIPGLSDVPYLTNTEMMELDFVPPHLVVLGGSYIGLEFAQMYRRFGSRVTVIEAADRLVPREDADVSSALREIVEAEGITVVTGARASAARRDGDDVVIELEGLDSIRGSHLLVAVGRTPNTDGLGLELAGVRTGPRGHVEVDDTLRTSAPHVWALGEVNGRGGFTHTAWNDYEIVAGNLLEGNSRSVRDRIPIYGLFTDPPLGRVGMSEEEARATGRPLLVGKRAMSRVGRARERGEMRGFIKIVADADTKELLGAAILGIEGDEAIHTIADTMYARAPYTTLQRAVHVHPTVSELIPTVVGEMRRA